jgi:hypothetical protein
MVFNATFNNISVICQPSLSRGLLDWCLFKDTNIKTKQCQSGFCLTLQTGYEKSLKMKVEILKDAIKNRQTRNTNNNKQKLE